MLASRSLPLSVLVASVVLGLLTGTLAVVAATRDEVAGRPPVLDRRAAQSSAIQVLRAWDARRSRAYARADGAALAALYVPGSRTGARDVAVLRDYRERGLRVTTMRSQVLEARVVRDTARRIVVMVTDLLVEAAVSNGAAQWSLPRDRPSTRRVVLVLRGGGWRVVETYAAD